MIYIFALHDKTLFYFIVECRLCMMYDFQIVIDFVFFFSSIHFISKAREIGSQAKQAEESIKMISWFMMAIHTPDKSIKTTGNCTTD